MAKASKKGLFINNDRKTNEATNNLNEILRDSYHFKFLERIHLKNHANHLYKLYYRS